MEDEASILLDGKALGNLRVVDLKQELEKRGLSKSGSKKDLVKRLKQQLEFEKLCGERKSTGDCDLKLELDADTEKNEFVQQYLAQQQKIYAEQKEVKRLIELEEIQRSGDERGSDSPKADDASDQETHPEESSDNESQAEEKAPVISEVRERGRRGFNRGSARSKEKAETVSETIVGRGASRDSDLDVVAQEERVINDSVSVKPTQNLQQTKCKEPRVGRNEGSVTIEEEDKKKENRIEEKQISAVPIDEVRINKESRLEVTSKKDTSSVSDDDVKSCIEESKVQVIQEHVVSSGYDEEEKGNEKSKIEMTDESMKVSGNTEEERLKKMSRVDDVEDVSLNKPRIINIEDESLNKSLVGSTENESMSKPCVENIADEKILVSSVKNIENQNMQVCCVENRKDENMQVCKVENTNNENLKVSKIENIEDETMKVSSVENIGEETGKMSRAHTLQKMKIDSGTVERIENQKSVSSSILPLADHGVQIQKLSERKSTEETSSILKNHPSSLDSSEIADLPSCGQSSNMEPATEISSVPYSVSDIQLPESPGSMKKPLSKSISEAVPTDQPIVETKTAHPTPTEGKNRTNGTDSNSSDESLAPDKQISEPEAASSNLNGESPREEKAAVVNSSDSAEKLAKDEPSNLPATEICEKSAASENTKDSKYSEGSEEGEMKSNSESATEESSDSHEHRRGRRKSQKVKRKGKQRRKSSTSDSSRSRSRERKQVKMDTEPGAKSDAPSVPGGVSTAPTKQRLKLKRDNVVVSDSLHTAKKNSSISQVSDENNRKSSDVIVEPAASEQSKTESVEEQPVPKYISTRKIRLTSRKLSEKSEDEPKGKKGKWGSFSNTQKTSQAISISTDSLKNWFPDFKLLKNPESVNEVILDDAPVPLKEESSRDLQADRMGETIDSPVNAVAVTKDETKVAESTAEQPSNDGEASNILFIQNLVRPFTLLQLKELLKEYGNMVEEKFWIDKIKSKCFVTYETEEEAVKTRNALNGSRWPSSNPKILSVEFATDDDLQFHQSGSEPPKPTPLPPPPVERSEDRTAHPATDVRKKERDPERRRERTKLPVREWDKNKLTQESPTRERASKSAERFKATDKREKKDVKRRPNEDTPAKLLDDLFQKTKSSPCIYWLPLTEEQVVEREESIRLRRVEREKRNQQRFQQEDNEHKNKSAQSRNRTREMETRRSSTRSRSPISRRR